MHSRLLLLSVIFCRALSAKKYVTVLVICEQLIRGKKMKLNIHFGEQALDLSHCWLSQKITLLTVPIVHIPKAFCSQGEYSQYWSGLWIGRLISPWKDLMKTFVSTCGWALCGLHRQRGSLHLESPSQIWVRNWLKFMPFCITRTSCQMLRFCVPSLA